MSETRTVKLTLQRTTRTDLFCIACGRGHPHCDFEVVVRGREAETGLHRACMGDVHTAKVMKPRRASSEARTIDDCQTETE